MKLHVMPLYGVGGKYSYGLDRLAEKVQREVGADAIVYPSAQWHEDTRLAKIIRGLRDEDRVMLVAHSGGANETTLIARGVAPAKIDLIVAYNPSWWMRNRVPIGGNVDRLIEIYGWNFFNPSGRPLLVTALGFKGTRENIYSRDTHVAVDDDTGLHDIIVKRVVGMMRNA